MGKDSKESGKTGTPTALFFSMGVDMSWRLALGVLIPVIGGAELDKTLKTSPWLLVVGLLLATALSTLTIRRTLKLTNKLTFVTDDKKETK